MYLQIVQGWETKKSWLPKQRIDEVFSYLQFIAFFIWHAEIVFWLYMYQTLINQAQNFPLRYYLIPRRLRNGWRRKRLNRLSKFHQFWNGWCFRSREAMGKPVQFLKCLSSRIKLKRMFSPDSVCVQGTENHQKKRESAAIFLTGRLLETMRRYRGPEVCTLKSINCINKGFWIYTINYITKNDLAFSLFQQCWILWIRPRLSTFIARWTLDHDYVKYDRVSGTNVASWSSG